MRWKKRNEKKIRARTDRLFRRWDKARERGKEREKRNIISGFLPLLLAHASLMLSTNVSRFSFFFLFSSFRSFLPEEEERRSFERLMRSSKIIDEFFVVFISRFVSGEENSIYREICYLFVHLFVRKIISRKKSQFF